MIRPCDKDSNYDEDSSQGKVKIQVRVSILLRTRGNVYPNHKTDTRRLSMAVLHGTPFNGSPNPNPKMCLYVAVTCICVYA